MQGSKQSVIVQAATTSYPCGGCSLPSARPTFSVVHIFPAWSTAPPSQRQKDTCGAATLFLLVCCEVQYLLYLLGGCPGTLAECWGWRSTSGWCVLHGALCRFSQACWHWWFCLHAIKSEYVLVFLMFELKM